jgi:hypothetical protein
MKVTAFVAEAVADSINTEQDQLDSLYIPIQTHSPVAKRTIKSASVDRRQIV